VQPGARCAVFTIPAYRSFADSLVAGLLARHGTDPLKLASGRILLPNNRAVRVVTEAFVRASGGGLLLPRLVPVGDPELDERVGSAIDPADESAPVPQAVEPLERHLALACMLRKTGESSAEAMRLAADLGRTLDALLIEEISPDRLADAGGDAEDVALHWHASFQRLRSLVDDWPRRLREKGCIDLAGRRNRLLRRLAERWRTSPPDGFTVAAGVTTTAPAVCALLQRVAFMPGGSVVLPGLALPSTMPDAEWEALGPDDNGRGDETHPQFHLKLLLDRMGVARSEVQLWRSSGVFASPPARGRAVANAMASAESTHKWQTLPASERRLSGVRLAELPDPAAEAQAIALALRQVLETPGRTAALVTPDRRLAMRVSALLQRWGIDADDSAGKPLSGTTAGTLLLLIASAAAEELAPTPLLALLKHPWVGGSGDARRLWLDDVRVLDRALRGPRPASGLAGLDRHFGEKEAERGCAGCAAAWQRVRTVVEPVTALAPGLSAGDWADRLGRAAEAVAGPQAWSGAEGRATADLIAAVAAIPEAAKLPLEAADFVPLLRQLLEAQQVRPPYGKHPRIKILGLLEARLQQADLMILGGLNEGVWPAPPAPDPWLAPRIRANLGLPGLERRIGLAAHDFAEALGAPEVLITRARRDGRSPTVASRFLLRLQAMAGAVERDRELEAWAARLDDPAKVERAGRPAPCPSAERRPKRISVTSVDRLRADPFSFYAAQVLGLRPLEVVDADHSRAWKGSAVHKVLEEWLKQDDCDPASLRPRAEKLLSDAAIHPMLRALWSPRLLEAIDWMAQMERDNQAAGRRPLAAEVPGEASLAGVQVYGRADRVDRLGDGALAIVDYKTGAPPKQKAVDAGFALQLGLLGLIARGGGFDGIKGEPGAHEYWSLTRKYGRFGTLMKPDERSGPDAFLVHCYRMFEDAAQRWLTGSEPFTAKLNPAYAPYADYDQLMRLEEWYGRE
jgi:ATP-dependent helicase/nuclease subunit B